jgi:O-antigen ligase
LALSKNQIWAIVIAGVFILMNAVAIYMENFLVSALPIILLIVVLAFLALDKLLLALVFMVPLSVPLKEFIPNLEIGMNLPTEPILFGVLLVFIFKILYEKQFDRSVLLHPVSVAIYFNIAWLLVTTVSSSLPIVSIKFLIARIWFVVAFYFLATQLFRDEKNMNRYLWFYIAGFMIVIGYALVRHAGYGIFNQKAAHWVSSPFYKDHTSYGALLSMFIPVLIGFGFYKKYSLNKKILIWAIAGFFIFAVIFSYTRAAWVSLIGAFCVWIVIKLRIKFKWLAALGVLVLIVLFVFRTQIMLDLEQNRQDSSKDLKEHVKSISNVSSDASNLERINRWASAIRM